MNYDELGIRERYNECMYDERQVIEDFLKKQYDLRYGRQRDSWHLEPAVMLMNIHGNSVYVTDIRLDNDKLVVFEGVFCSERSEYECGDFAYGELSKIIEALPDADDIVRKNVIADLEEQNNNLRIDLLLEKHPLVYETSNGTVRLEEIEAPIHNSLFTKLGEMYGLDFLVTLRDHIHIEHLHHTKEYKEVMKWLALEPNLRKSVDEYTKTNYGCVLFPIKGTDIEFDMSAIQRDDEGNLTIFGADTCCEDELITLTEKDIEKEYLEVILKWLTTRGNIMDTYNGHNPELVRKINAAWRDTKYHDRFGDILFALGCRDAGEIEDKYDIKIDCNETAMDNANEIMEGVCDDLDLECILKFVRWSD